MARQDLPKLSARKVHLPRAPFGGSSLYYVKRGELIEFETALVDGGTMRQLARVLGSVAEYWQPGDTNLKGYICALVLGTGGRFGYIRYLRPDQVTVAYEQQACEFLRYFAGPLGTADDVRLYAEYGALSSHYVWEHCNPDGTLKPYGDMGRPGHIVAQDSK